jgi:hypothetical protein
MLMKRYSYREGLQTIIAEVGQDIPNAANFKFEDFANPSIVQKLDKSGFIDGLYKKYSDIRLVLGLALS